jgi:two-component system aerobic respiration control sensor histidine kinase ArcB
MIMDVLEILFNFGLCLNAVLFIPQVYKVYKNKSAHSISLTSYFSLLFVQFVFMLHSIAVNNFIAAVSMGFGSFFCLSVIILTIQKIKNISSVASLSSEEIMDQLPCNVYWRDKEGTYYGLNKSCRDTLAGDTVGSNLHDILPKDEADRVMIYDHEVMRSKKLLMRREHGPIREDGTQTIFLSAKKPIFDGNNEVIGLVGVSFDYTDIDLELKQKVDLLDNLVASMPGHIYWVDEFGKYVGCNNNYANSIGITNRSSINGKMPNIMSTLTHPDQIEINNKKVFSERVKLVVEEKSIRSDGTLATMLTNKAPLYDSENNIKGVLSCALDISSLKEENEKTKKNLIDLNTECSIKHKFINNMSYDIRTPVAGIIAMANAIIEKTEISDPEVKETGIKVVQAGTKLLDVLNEIVAISEPGSGLEDLQQKRISLRTIVTNVIDISIPAAHQKQLKIKFEFDDNIPEYLLSDPIRVHRILFNLIFNAIKFTSEGLITVTAFLSQHEADRYIIKLGVKDTGIGICQEKQKVIFSQNTKKSSGYGLKVVQEFINDLNGEICVNSNEGSGAEFVCHIPFKKSLDQSTVNNLSESSINYNSFKHKDILRSLAANVLLVDDDHLSQTATKILLKNFGCNVTIANDGSKALKSIRKGRFDMVFMDIGLPDISGFNVIENIRAKLDNANKDLPIVVLTAHEDISQLDNIPKSITDIYSKPITMDIIEKLLAKYLLKKLEGERIVDLETA